MVRPRAGPLATLKDLRELVKLPLYPRQRRGKFTVDNRLFRTAVALGGSFGELVDF